jgi:hypothetical protein
MKTINNFCGDFSDVEIGTRFTVLRINTYMDKAFPKGSIVTFLGTTIRSNENYSETVPRFQFDGDAHKERMLSRNELKQLTP